jgi:hypothetical protein
MFTATVTKGSNWDRLVATLSEEVARMVLERFFGSGQSAPGFPSGVTTTATGRMSGQVTVDTAGLAEGTSWRDVWVLVRIQEKEQARLALKEMRDRIARGR